MSLPAPKLIQAGFGEYRLMPKALSLNDWCVWMLFHSGAKMQDLPFCHIFHTLVMSEAHPNKKDKSDSIKSPLM